MFKYLTHIILTLFVHSLELNLELYCNLYVLAKHSVLIFSYDTESQDE